MKTKKKSAKKKPAPRIKTAIVSEFEVYEIYEGETECPYCHKNTTVEGHGAPPTQSICNRCKNKFKVKFTDEWERQ